VRTVLLFSSVIFSSPVVPACTVSTTLVFVVPNFTANRPSVGQTVRVNVFRQTRLRIASNVVATIHRASSPWNGRSAQRQVGTHTYTTVVFVYPNVVYFISRYTSTTVIALPPDRVPVGGRRRCTVVHIIILCFRRFTAVGRRA